MELDSIYGCPDCADGGAEWIEIQDDQQIKKVTFEYGDTLAPIENLMLELRDLREAYLELDL